jgi:spore maturation protein CgeB
MPPPTARWCASSARRGHDVLFLERDVPWYAGHRDMPDPPFGRTVLYDDLDELQRVHGRAVATPTW